MICQSTIPLSLTSVYESVRYHNFRPIREPKTCPSMHYAAANFRRPMETSPQLRQTIKDMAESDPTKLPTPSACTAGIQNANEN